MKNLVLVLILAIFSSCATKFEKRKIFLNQIQTDMASLNKTIRGELLRTTMKGDLSALNMFNYRKIAMELASQSEKEYVVMLKDEGTELAINSGKRKFAVCAKNKELVILICDFTDTGASTDFDSYDMSLDIRSKANEFFVN